MSRDTIRARVAAATEGPWRWGGNLDNREVYLSTVAHGRIFVMRFARWGMNQARPLLRNDLGMAPATDWAVRERPYRGDIERIDHPDARFIAHARQDIPALLAVADAAAAASPFLCSCGCLTDERAELVAALAALEALP